MTAHGDTARGAFAASPQEGREALALTAWRRLLLAVGGCVLAWGFHRLIGNEGAVFAWALALLLSTAWFAAIRFLLLDSSFRRFWMIALAVASLLILLLGASEANPIPSILISLAFLLVRKYRPFQLLTGHERMRIFLLGVLAFLLITLDWNLAGQPVEGASWPHAIGRAFARWSVTSLRFFWFFSLLQLFFHMRLHFMRLKPKLAVSALFIALVPLVLVVVFGVVLTYGMLGGSRAARTSSLLRLWARQTEQGAILSPLPFPTRLHAAPDSFFYADAARGGASLPFSERPVWFDHLIAMLSAPPRLTFAAEPTRAAEEAPSPEDRRRPRGTFTIGSRDRSQARIVTDEDTLRRAWSPRDTTAYAHMQDGLWLVRMRQTGTPRLAIDAYKLDDAALDHLAQLLNCDIGILGPDQVMMGEADSARIAASMADTTRSHLRGYFQRMTTTAPGSKPIWRRPISFGGGFLDILSLRDDRIVPSTVFYHLDVRLSDLAREFARSDYQFNQAIFFGMAVIAGLFLILEGLALFLGIRITGGIISAVNALHAGTVRLAGGDLETRIELPNQDEFGMLAGSFNEMTVAVQRGREAAIARETLERELQTARTIQQRLLPRSIPDLPGFDMIGASVPSRQVGGDYFDFLSLEPGRIGVAIADVSGKGMPAALLMANLQASLQGQVIHPSSVAEIVARVNDLLARSTDAQMFATFFYGVLDSKTGTFTSVNAGHNPPLLLKADGSMQTLNSGGVVLGMLQGMPYEQETMPFAPGDLLVLYTDGVTEAEGPTRAEPSGRDLEGANLHAAEGTDFSGAEGEDDVPPMFGEERVIRVVREHAHRSAVEIKEAILSEVDRFSAGMAQSDDITLVVIKRRRSEAQADGRATWPSGMGKEEIDVHEAR